MIAEAQKGASGRAGRHEPASLDGSRRSPTHELPAAFGCGDGAEWVLLLRPADGVAPHPPGGHPAAPARALRQPRSRRAVFSSSHRELLQGVRPRARAVVVEHQVVPRVVHRALSSRCCVTWSSDAAGGTQIHAAVARHDGCADEGHAHMQLRQARQWHRDPADGHAGDGVGGRRAERHVGGGGAARIQALPAMLPRGAPDVGMLSAGVCSTVADARVAQAAACVSAKVAVVVGHTRCGAQRRWCGAERRAGGRPLRSDLGS